MVAFLYSCLILIIELFCHKKRALWFISLPLMVYLTAETCLRMGLSGELEHVLLPDGYFTLRLQAGSIIYLPWGLTLAVFITSGLCKSFRFKRRWMQGTLIAAQLACAVAFTFVGIPQYIDRNNEVFKELNHYARHCQWDKITDKCENMPMNNLLFQNYHNVALAEQGLLADQLFMQPCIDIQTIYVPGNKTPYLSALLSDIYFSMGHIAFSQRYAFEANEGMGNFSPRMLQRLVQTSLIYGHYGTAKKCDNELPLEFAVRADEKLKTLGTDTSLVRIMNIIEKAEFSKEEISEQERAEVYLYTKQLYALVLQNSGRIKRMWIKVTF